MGKFTFRLPDIGEGIAEAEIVAWHVKVGDRIEEDGRLADMMTDKATVEMESPVSGKVLAVAGEVGDVVAIGSPLVVIEVEGEGAEEEAPAPKAETVEQRIEAETPDAGDVERAVEAEAPPVRQESVRPEPVGREAEAKPQRPSFSSSQAPRPKEESRASTSSARTETGVAPRVGAKVLASPAVRARARELGIDLAEVRPAEDGRVRHADLDAFLSYNAGGGFRAPGTRGEDAQVRVIGLRRRIAENMAASKRNIPHFSYVEE
ncbi:MAG TPA: biotin/lipoyl-containing protein [Reyranella sp.]|nr:biotin/lipoyl-containing protein [Reyranella sp.]